jgi:hypothetical protein
MPNLLNGNHTYEIFRNGKAIGFATSNEVYEILRHQLTEDDLRKLPMSEQEAVEYHFASGRDEYTYVSDDGEYVFTPVKNIETMSEWHKYPDERPTNPRNVHYLVRSADGIYLAMYRHDVNKFFDTSNLDFLDGIDAPIAKYWKEIEVKKPYYSVAATTGGYVPKE